MTGSHSNVARDSGAHRLLGLSERYGTSHLIVCIPEKGAAAQLPFRYPEAVEAEWILEFARRQSTNLYTTYHSSGYYVREYCIQYEKKSTLYRICIVQYMYSWTILKIKIVEIFVIYLLRIPYVKINIFVTCKYFND